MVVIELIPFILGLFSAERVTALLLIWMIIETGILLYYYKDYMLNYPGAEESNTLRVAEDYASNSLTFASLTFAGLTFILAQFFQEDLAFIDSAVFLFTIGFGLFISSYKLEVFAPTLRILLSTQQRLFNFGVLFIVSGLAIFFSEISTQLMIPITALAAVIIILHLAEFVDDFQTYSVEVDRLNEETKQCTLNDFRP